MEAAELDIQLEELEIRLERLRALYEQYFLGIEKIEPTVPRKDVDRRIYVLRREKIRNTAKRFKLQTIIQRYNTFQQYWQRICREIENGTYKRHVLRAERSYGTQDLLTIAARKRLGKAKSDAPAEPASAPPQPEPAAEASPTPAAAAPRSPLAPPPVPAGPRAPLAPPPAPAGGRAASPPPAAAAKARTPPPARPAFESLDLDMDFLGDWDPAKAKKPASAPKHEKPAAAAKPSKPEAPAPAAAPQPPAAEHRAAAPAIPRAAVPAAAKAAAARTAPENPAPVPRAKPPAADLSDAHIKELHGRLNALKKQNQEAGQVSLEGLAKSLRATQEKLRAKHSGRRIDFDVVIKDGKAVVKPIIR